MSQPNMSQPGSFSASERVRAFGYFVIAGIYFFFAQLVAGKAANGLSSGDWSAPVERAILLFLVLVGFGAMGRAFQRQARPLEAMGLAFRPGAWREFGLGAALAWAMVIVSILPMVFSGGLLVSFSTSPHDFALLLLDLLTLALASLAEEVAFRGYPFQRLIEAIGPFLATLGLSVLFGVAHIFNPNSTRTAVVVTIFAGWLLSIAYLRTRALWLAWGWHFAWNISICMLFGLPISGLTRFSPVIQSDTIGPVWMTGGDYGPEGSVAAAVVLLVGIIAIFRITRHYAHRYVQPAIVPHGMPIDFDATGQGESLYHPPEPPGVGAQGEMQGETQGELQGETDRESQGDELVQIDPEPASAGNREPTVDPTPPNAPVFPSPAQDRGAVGRPDPRDSEG